jgi:hypothetical protein
MNDATEAPAVVCYLCAGPTGDGSVRLRVSITPLAGRAEGAELVFTRRVRYGRFCAGCVAKAPTDLRAREVGTAKAQIRADEPLLAAIAEADPDDPDDWPAVSDDLEKLGFEFDDEAVMSLRCGTIPDCPQIVVRLHGNQRREDWMTAASVSLYWVVSRHPTKASGSFGIRDNPTLRQIKELVAALKGE